MIEANENIDLVTLRRQHDLESSRREAQALGTPAAPVATAAPDGLDAAGLAQPVVAVEPDASQSPDAAPAPAETDGSGVRLAITAALVVVLFVVWAFQKRSARAS